MKMHQNPVFYI